jgi:type VI protein secretion system component VasK
MSNPYQPPTVQTHKHSARTWIILSVLLFVALAVMSVILLRAARMAEISRAQTEAARRKAVITNLKTLGERMHQKDAEAASGNE